MCHQRRLKKKSRLVTRSRMVADQWSKPQWRSLRSGHNSFETQLGQQRTVIAHPQDQLEAPANDNRCGQSGTNTSHPSAPDARGNLVDLRAGNKPETFTSEAHAWKGWLFFKMRQYTSVVDEELYVELVDVETNALRELLMTAMNEAQKKRGRQLALTLTMHTEDRALQIITKLSGPTNGFEVWRRFLEEWEPRTGLGGVGATCAPLRCTKWRHAR